MMMGTDSARRPHKIPGFKKVMESQNVVGGEKEQSLVIRIYLYPGWLWPGKVEPGRKSPQIYIFPVCTWPSKPDLSAFVGGKRKCRKNLRIFSAKFLFPTLGGVGQTTYRHPQNPLVKFYLLLIQFLIYLRRLKIGNNYVLDT